MIEKPSIYRNFDIIEELKNLCVKIPLLQSLQDIPIYANENSRIMWEEAPKEN